MEDEVKTEIYREGDLLIIQRQAEPFSGALLVLPAQRVHLDDGKLSYQGNAVRLYERRKDGAAR